jgi:predicted dehydrogenase
MADIAQQPEAASVVRLAVIGCDETRGTYGSIYKHVPGISIVALCDQDLSVSRAWGREFRASQVYTETSELYEDAEFDAVLLAGPVEDRAAEIEQAASAGKHILCELPLGGNTRSLNAALTAVEEAGVKLLPAFVKRFDPYFAQASEMLQYGELGALRQVRCDWGFFMGWVERKPSLNHWRAVFEDLTCQTIDLCRMWLGEVESVSGDVEHAEFGAGGELANMIVQHQRGVSVHHISRASNKAVAEQYLLTGDAATLHMGLSGAYSAYSAEPFVTTLHGIGAAPQELTIPLILTRDALLDRHPYKRMLDHFARCILEDEPLAVTAEDFVRAQETVTAACLSSLEQVKIGLPLGRSEQAQKALKRFWGEAEE